MLNFRRMLAQLHSFRALVANVRNKKLISNCTVRDILPATILLNIVCCRITYSVELIKVQQYTFTTRKISRSLTQLLSVVYPVP